MPRANLPGLSRNYLATTLSGNNNNRTFSRLDQNFTQAAHVYVRYAWQNAIRRTTSTNPYSDKYEKIPDRNIVVNYTHIISSSMVNEFRFGAPKDGDRHAESVSRRPGIGRQ